MVEDEEQWEIKSVWFKNLEAMNKRCMCLSLLTEESSVQIIMYLDASDTVYRCYWTNESVDKQVLDCYGF